MSIVGVLRKEWEEWETTYSHLIFPIARMTEGSTAKRCVENDTHMRSECAMGRMQSRLENGYYNSI